MKNRKMGIIGAMSEEVELLHRHVEVTQKHEKAGLTLYEGTLHGRDVVYGKSGVGKVNAAVCTQFMIDLGAGGICFTGVAGALDPELEIGDLVISSSCVQHDMDASPLGFARGEVPFQEVSDYAADGTLVELARQTGERLFPGRCLVGKVLSGDQFIASRESVQMLREEMGGACVEMEGAALAQVCWMNGTPFVVIRSMSDKADGSAQVNFETFTQEAADRSYRFVSALVEAL
ncbi:5'-methylthioadenosine/adenosylhomocysteine nucleosidase [Paenibacillus sp. IB182496]|uniref:adenosylhomocysteine nucleosidase n=1 Tax=Paenibacillus sabuli TaxID=2772509 RepID=A0A927BUY6_9BACL|nr:5'-methylthioadenosine/adenosylhomocysteine nucleosidase [Paenibacillus sabuli]MBD2846215.1 5'-methylthioadenosine/adenosylhomocysteine nucleosidase [Paenibacillus sabuli]